MSPIQAYQPPLLAKQFQGKHPAPTIVKINPRTMCFQMHYLAPYVEVFNIIRLVREGTTPVVFLWEMETGTPSLMILPWICMLTSFPVYWFVNWKFLADQSSAEADQEANKPSQFHVLVCSLDPTRNDKKVDPSLLKFLVCFCQPSDWFGVLKCSL